MNKFHVNQVKKLGPDERKFLVVASLASYVPNALLNAILDDDRIPRRRRLFSVSHSTSAAGARALPLPN